MSRSLISISNLLRVGFLGSLTRCKRMSLYLMLSLSFSCRYPPPSITVPGRADVAKHSKFVNQCCTRSRSVGYQSSHVVQLKVEIPKKSSVFMAVLTRFSSSSSNISFRSPLMYCALGQQTFEGGAAEGLTRDMSWAMGSGTLHCVSYFTAILQCRLWERRESNFLNVPLEHIQ